MKVSVYVCGLSILMREWIPLYLCSILFRLSKIVLHKIQTPQPAPSLTPHSITRFLEEKNNIEIHLVVRAHICVQTLVNITVWDLKLNLQRVKTQISGLDCLNDWKITIHKGAKTWHKAKASDELSLDYSKLSGLFNNPESPEVWMKFRRVIWACKNWSHNLDMNTESIKNVILVQK